MRINFNNLINKMGDAYEEGALKLGWGHGNKDYFLKCIKRNNSEFSYINHFISVSYLSENFLRVVR